MCNLSIPDGTFYNFIDESHAPLMLCAHAVICGEFRGRDEEQA